MDLTSLTPRKDSEALSKVLAQSFPSFASKILVHDTHPPSCASNQVCRWAGFYFGTR